MGKIKKKIEENNPDKLIKDLIDSDAWLLITVKKDFGEDPGATVAIRESYPKAAIDMISMLLEQKEIYDAVSLNMAKTKMEMNKKGGNSPDLNVN